MKYHSQKSQTGKKVVVAGVRSDFITCQQGLLNFLYPTIHSGKNDSLV